ncbi:hypothetical protein [Streptomyces sp. NPDC012888]|uniref:hypothetical protein n=1 Tax=Streptomyces sp. NPDC012888 TaxID=3364855 RepID=UPI0036CAE546
MGKLYSAAGVRLTTTALATLRHHDLDTAAPVVLHVLLFVPAIRTRVPREPLRLGCPSGEGGVGSVVSW